VEFDVPSPAPGDVPIATNPDQETDEPVESDATDNDEATQLPLGSLREIATLCRRHLAFADGIAFEVHARVGDRVTLDVVVSAARIGLWHAARRYDPTRNVTFEAFAQRRVAGAIVDVLRTERVLPRLRGGRTPGLAAMLAACSYASKPEEFYDAQEIGWLLAWRAETGIGAVPVAGTVSLSGAVEMDRSLADEALEQAELLAILRAAIAELEPRDRALVNGTYFQGLTLAEAGGVTGSWASRLHREVLVRLKRAMLRAGYRERFAAEALPPLVASAPCGAGRGGRTASLVESVTPPPEGARASR